MSTNPHPVGTDERADWETVDPWVDPPDDEGPVGQEACRPGAPCGNCELCERDSWAPIDLGPYLRGEVVRPEPSIGLARTDGLRLLYPGKEHAVIGEMEAGKSWISLACAVAEMDAGNTVVYIHFEETDPSDTIDRMLELGATTDQILKLFRFVGPERQVSTEALARLLDPVPSLAILDGVNEGMSLHRLAIREEDGAATFRRHVVKPFIRAGAATLACDHVVKDKETRGRYALGSVHKGNALNGVQIMLENAEPFGRGQRGRSHVFLTKDRPGYLRRHGKPTKTSGKTFMGELVVDDTRQWNPWLELKFWAPSEDTNEPDADTDAVSPGLADDVCRVISGLPGQAVTSERSLFAVMRKAGHRARNTAIKDAVDDLIATGRIEETSGLRGAKAYRVLTASQDQTGEPT